MYEPVSVLWSMMMASSSLARIREDGLSTSCRLGDGIMDSTERKKNTGAGA